MEVDKETNQNANSHDSSSSSSLQGGENLPSQSPKCLPRASEHREKRSAFKKSQASNSGASGRSSRLSRAVPNPAPEDEANAGSVHLTRSEIPSSLRSGASRTSVVTAVRLNAEQFLTVDTDGDAHIVPASTVPSSQITDTSESMDLDNGPRGRRVLRILRNTQTKAEPASADTADILDDSEQNDVRLFLCQIAYSLLKIRYIRVHELCNTK